MGVEWGKIGQNNSHALRNVGSFPQTLAAVPGAIYRASGLSPLRLTHGLSQVCTSDVYLPVSGSLVAYRLPYGAG
jgi:hypothetical protein